MVEYLRSEQSDGSQVIDILLTDGNKEKVMEKDVLQFIEENDMGSKEVFSGNKMGNNDPQFDLYCRHEADALQYLDDNFEYVCKLYYKHLIKKR